MKYKLIHKATSEEHLCDKVTINGFEYYVSNEEPTLSDALNTCYYIFNSVLYKREYSHHKGCKKVIATNNPNIDIPQILEEPNETLIHQIAADLGYRMLPDDLEEGIKAGYKESQETHPFSEEDMIDFADFVEKSNYDSDGFTQHQTPKELLQLWKEQKPKKIYYNE